MDLLKTKSDPLTASTYPPHMGRYTKRLTNA